MVNRSLPSSDAHDAERALALSYACDGDRAGLTALLALDRRLGEIVRAAREPMIGQMRLTWWHEALSGLDTGLVPAEPLLAELAAALLPRGVRGVELAAMIDGWELLLDGVALDDAALATFAAARGGRLFALAERLVGASDEAAAASGEGWALVDLATHWSDARTVARAQAMATVRLAGRRRWSRAARPLGALSLLAAADLKGTVPGVPSRVARLLAHRLTGW